MLTKLSSTQINDYKAMWGNMDAGAVLIEARQVLTGISADQKATLVHRSVPLKVLCLPKAEDLRQLLSADGRLELVLRQWEKVDQPPISFLAETAAVVGEAIKARQERLNALAKKALNAADWDRRATEHDRHRAAAEAAILVSVLPLREERARAAKALPAWVLLRSAELREFLPSDEKIAFYRAQVTRQDCPDVLFTEFPSALAGAMLEKQVEIWDEVLGALPEAHPLAAHMPKAVAYEREHIRYKGFFDALGKLEAYDFDPVVAFAPANSYGPANLDSRDFDLAGLWTGNTSEAELAKMLSARAAEKIVKKFFERFGHRVTDVAVQQLDKGAPNWQDYDLLVDSQTPIDVKNARSPVNNRESYFDHTVPAFKKSRSRVDVRIVGVKSPYLKLEHIKDPSSVPSHWTDLDAIFLGLTSLSDLTALKGKFVSSMLEDISFKRGDATLIPPWAFVYPKNVYEYAELSSFADEIVGQPAPTWEALQHFRVNPLPLFITALAPLPQAWQQVLPSWKIQLASELNLIPRRSLPHIFLTVLTNFLGGLRTAPEGFDPGGYYDLLYPATRAAGVLNPWRQLPLGVLDPLATVWNLCKTLALLWEYRDESRLQEFTRFRLDGAGLLRGGRSGEDRWITLVAYCGGFTKDKSKCGHSPLVLGKHDECATCGYLVCPVCAHCKEDCLGLARRSDAQNGQHSAGRHRF